MKMSHEAKSTYRHIASFKSNQIHRIHQILFYSYWSWVYSLAHIFKFIWAFGECIFPKIFERKMLYHELGGLAIPFGRYDGRSKIVVYTHSSRVQ